VYWHTQAGVLEEDGSTKPLCITFREYIRNGLSERALAEEIVAVNNGDPVQNIYGGHDLWKQDSPGPTKEQSMNQVFHAAGLPTMKRAAIDRVDGWRLMHRMLDEGQWIITKNCKNAIEAMPTAIFDEKKQNEDVLKTNDMHDDVRDSLRYGLYSQYGPKDVSFEVKLKARTAHLTDLTNRNMHIAKLVSERDNSIRARSMANNRGVGRAGRYGR